MRKSSLLNSLLAAAAIGFAAVIAATTSQAQQRSATDGKTTGALNVIDSPRLYVPADVADNLSNRLHSPFLKGQARRVLRDADWLVKTDPVQEGQESSYQRGTRAIDSHLQCLTAAWVLTRDRKYRKAAIKHLAGLLEWNHISCEANPTLPPEKKLPFCLSYGELSASVGLMYDLFRPEMTKSEQRVFFAVLDKFLLRQALQAVKRPPWWANKSWSNWNGVCAGGMGIMALAIYKDRPEAQKIIPFVEKSLGEYFKSYKKYNGGCAEGTGYWNYGMNYAMRYVLSWENATGNKHPALEIEELGKSLFFPLDFTGISFGDNDGWHPTAFYFLLARRLNMREAALNAAAYLPRYANNRGKRHGIRAVNGDLLYAADAIPPVEVMDKYQKNHETNPVPVARVYDGLDWAALADDEAFPSLRMSVRGGSSKIAGHGMLDLLSFKCRVNGELMITDQKGGGYMATTFSGRGHEIYSRRAASKSTLFVDGLGCRVNAECNETEVVKGDGILGIRVDGSRIYMPRWRNMFIGRLVLMVGKEYWLVVDQVLSPREINKHWAESRFHTFADAENGKDWVALKSGDEQMQITFASLEPGVLQKSRGMPPQPRVPQTTIFRWMSKKARHDNLHVAALNPGTEKLDLELRKEKSENYVITVTKPDGSKRKIRIAPELRLN